MALNSIPAASADPASWVGEMVGPYRLTKRFHENLWCRTFVALAPGGKEHIIVFFHKEWARHADPQQRAPGALVTLRQFSQVRGVHTSLEHGRVSSGLLAGLDYVVMARVAGMRLGAYLITQGGTLPLVDAALIVHQVAEVLHAGHLFRTGEKTTPVFHGSLHLSDIILEKEPPYPRVRVGGYERFPFVVAAVEDEFRKRRDQDVSPELADWLATVAPEVVSRKSTNRRVTERTDVYGLGVLFWTLLFGRPPHTLGEEPERLMPFWARNHNSKHPLPTLPAAATSLSPNIQKLLRECVSNDIGSRPHTPRDVAAVLELLVPEVARAKDLPAIDPADEEAEDMSATIHRPSPVPPTFAAPPEPPPPQESPVPPLPPAPEKSEPLSASAPPLAPGRGETYFGGWQMGAHPPPSVPAAPPSPWGKVLFVCGALLCAAAICIYLMSYGTPRPQPPSEPRVPNATQAPPEEADPGDDAATEPVFTEVVTAPPPVARPAPTVILVPDPRDSALCTETLIRVMRRQRASSAGQQACARFCAASPALDDMRSRLERHGLCPRAGPAP